MSTSHTSRLLFVLIAVMGIGLGIVVPTAAHANSAVCALGSHSATWSPGVTNAVAMHEVPTGVTNASGTATLVIL
jgi:hypothetical protein